MKRTMIYKKTKLLRRVAAVLLDAIIAFVTFIVIHSFIAEPIVKNTTNYNDMMSEYIDIYETSYIFKYDGKSIQRIGENFDYNFSKFYEKYDSLENYENKKKDSGLFKLDESSEKYSIEIGSADQMYKFYDEQFNEAYKIFIKNPRLVFLHNEIYKIRLITLLIPVIVSFIIVFLLIPIILKNGQTIGKKAMHIKIISKKGDGVVTNIQTIFRFFIDLIVMMLLSVLIYGIPLIVNLAMIILMKNRDSIEDILCSTLCIDNALFEDERKLRESDKIYIEYENNDILEEEDEK